MACHGRHGKASFRPVDGVDADMVGENVGRLSFGASSAELSVDGVYAGSNDGSNDDLGGERERDRKFRE